MGRKNRRKREHIKPIHVNRYINKAGKTKKKPSTVTTVNKADIANSAQEQSQPTQILSQPTLEGLQHPLNSGSNACHTYSVVGMQDIRPHRNEIWFADLGSHYGTSVQCGVRPVFVISNDVANRYSATVTVIPATTKMKRLELPTHVRLDAIDCKCFGSELFEASLLLAEQITTIDRKALREKIAIVTSRSKMAEVEKAVAVQLNIKAQSV